MKRLLPLIALLLITATSCKKERCYRCLINSVDNSGQALPAFEVSGCDMTRAEVEEDAQKMERDSSYHEGGIMKNNFAQGRPTDVDCTYD